MTNNGITSSVWEDTKPGFKQTQSFTDARATFSELFNNANLFAVVMSSNAQIIYCNSYFVRMTSLSVEEVMGSSWSQIFGSNWGAEFGTDFANWLNSKPDALCHDSDLMTQAGECYKVRWNTMDVSA